MKKQQDRVSLRILAALGFEALPVLLYKKGQRFACAGYQRQNLTVFRVRSSILFILKFARVIHSFRCHPRDFDRRQSRSQVDK